ncbi:MAG: PhnD/SsuA/transferrin family substrate-binding protein, partial [Planctomycetia bacterium]|nr:PhnD/SsuA/transferrin family substrate-binding protein [Planctomycetia bacterium]
MAISLLALAGCHDTSPRHDGDVSGTARGPLRIVVMDPMALPLSCECVEGFAQRRYERLGEFLEKRLGRPVEIAFSENLQDVIRINEEPPALIIGKQSVVLFDAAGANVKVRPLARLTGAGGSTELFGVFAVRHDDPAKRIKDLAGYRILFGPKESEEKHGAAVAALKKHGVQLPAEIQVSGDCTTAALAVIENDADVAVLSSYSLALLEGCDSIDKGVLRVIGRTAPVPFVVAFATDSLGANEDREITRALLAVGREPELLKVLETKDGFVPMPGGEDSRRRPWPDWRGARQDAITRDVPDDLPAKPKLLWRHGLTGWGLSGLAVSEGLVVVADERQSGDEDIWRCLDAESGKLRWVVRYPARGEMDYSNAPRAGAVINDGRVDLLGACGHLR